MKKMTIYGNNLLDIIIIRNYTKYQEAYKPEKLLTCHAQINIVRKSFNVKILTGPDSKAAKFNVRNMKIKTGRPKFCWCSTNKPA